MAETDSGERRAAGTEPGTEPVTERDTEWGTEWGTERGTEWDTEPDTEPATERGTEPGTERGAEPDTERGTEPGTERGAEPGTERGTEPGTERGTEPGTAGAPQKPPYSCVALITMAIRASPEQRLPLSGIYAYIAGRFPFYRGPSRRWQNSVRHHLSLNPCFRRLPPRHGRAGHWALDPAFQDMFPGGNYLRRCRCRLPSASPPPPSGIAPSPAWPRPPPPCAVPPVPAGCPQGPWAVLVLPCGYPQLPAWGPPVLRGLPLPLPAWALSPAELDVAVAYGLGVRLFPAFR
ncbi:forkhead box protein E3-like [Corvus moneduloides]|uniref:forkhead box protein E3-like n=1 Tax=Corvus moneduloides TaxID=1196302 RepID=UPI001362B7D1|nr:forkhead box protein E3-like [Corvus moneduloides]